MTNDNTTHFGFKQVPINEKVSMVRGVFDSVAGQYDVMNDLMSWGLHRAWKEALVTALNRILAPNDLFGVMTTDMRPRDLVFGRKVLTTEDMLSRYWFWGRRDTILRTPEEQVLEFCTRNPQTGDPLRARDGERATKSTRGARDDGRANRRRKRAGRAGARSHTRCGGAGRSRHRAR